MIQAEPALIRLRRCSIQTTDRLAFRVGLIQALGPLMKFKVNRYIFHLSLPVHDLEETRAFYCSVLGAARGRVTPEWIDLIVFGHQITFHQRPEQVVPPEAQGVQHFGAILPWEEWEALCAAVAASGYPLLVQPAVFGQDTPAEHGKLLLRDPSGHMLEFKAYRDLGAVLPGNEPNNSFKPKPLRGSA